VLLGWLAARPAPSHAAVLLAFAAFTLAWPTFSVAGFRLVARLSPDGRGFGLCNAVTAVAFLVSPVLAGEAASRFGYGAVWVFTAAAMVVATAMALLPWRSALPAVEAPALPVRVEAPQASIIGLVAWQQAEEPRRGAVPPVAAPSEAGAAEGAASFDFLLPPEAPGELGRLAGYRVIELLGTGGMGMVFAAVDVQLERSVALKVLHPELSRDPELRRRFLLEARATAAIESDSIVTIHQVGEHEGVLFVAMEFLRGESLDRWHAAHPQPSVVEILRIGTGIARGLAAAHEKGHLHRDIKPANVWLEEPGGRVKVFDFGMTRPIRGGEQLTRVGLFLGTPGYMAPEQADGADVDARCDLFSLGCVLYELASGEQAFPGATITAQLKAVATKEPAPLQRVNPAVPRELADLVAALLSKDPAGRPGSAQEVAEALEAMRAGAEGGKPLGRGVSRLHDWLAPRGRHRALLPAAGALVAAVLVAAAFGGWILPVAEEGGQGTESAAAKPASTAQGVTDSEIVLGMTAAFSGPAQETGKSMRAGILTCIGDVNARGGVAGRKLRLVALDDGYEPARALANARELDEKHRVFAFVGNVGTPTAEVTMPYAASRRMLFFGAYSGASLLRDDPPNRYVFNYRASYLQETEKIVQYLTEVRGIEPRQIAVFAQQDAYGDSGFEGVARALRKKGWPTDRILRVGYVRNTADVDAAAGALLARPEIRAVVMVPTALPAARFIQALHDGGRADLVFANVSFVDGRALGAELARLGPRYAKGVIVTQVVPHPDAGSSLALRTRDLLARHQPAARLDFISLEGFVATAVLAAALERVEGELTTESLVAALEALRDLDLGLGATLGYGPSDHQASDRVWGTVMDDAGELEILRDMSD
jgi:ABC-type branched-subunit amino acid transport system substrate-binding protein